jgi:hypothetical protein
MTKRILAALVLSAAVALGQPNSVGKVAYLEGQVLILSYGSRVPRPAELGETVFRGDQIKTIRGKCQVNITAGGILRLSPNTTMAFATKEWEDPLKLSVIARKLGNRWVENFRQLIGLDPDDPFHVRDDFSVSDYISPPPPQVVAQRAREDQERLAARQRARPPASQPAGNTEDQLVAEYRSLLPAVLQAEKKPWHTRFEFLANAVKTGTGYRVAYKTYCLIDKGPDAGKDYACYEFDSVLDLGTIKTALVDMRRRLGR